MPSPLAIGWSEQTELSGGSGGSLLAGELGKCGVGGHELPQQVVEGPGELRGGVVSRGVDEEPTG